MHVELPQSGRIDASAVQVCATVFAEVLPIRDFP